MTLSLIELRSRGDSTYDVILGEGEGALDVSGVVEQLRLSVRGGNVPTVFLEFTAWPKFAIEADVVVDEQTHAALVALGWTPPPDRNYQSNRSVEESHGTHDQARVVDLPRP